MKLVNSIKTLAGLLLLGVMMQGCKTAPKESEFTKTAREAFFGVDLSASYDDALAYFKANNNLVDIKMFDSASAGREFSHQFIFQKHPWVKQGMKAGSLYLSHRGSDSADFRQVIYFLSTEDALRSFQQMDAKLRKPSNQVITSDSTNKKVVMYAAKQPDAFHGMLAELINDSAGKTSVLTLNLVKNQYGNQAQ